MCVCVRAAWQVCPVEGCPGPPPPPIIAREPFVRDWSNATQWPGGVVPAAGADVLVERPWRLRLDVEPEAIRHLVVEGELFFDERRASTTLQADTIHIVGLNVTADCGVLRAGNSTASPFPGEAIIQLNGNRASPMLRYDDRDPGSKAILVLGDLLLYGQPRFPPVSHVHLLQPAPAGTTKILVDQVSHTPHEIDC